MIYVEFVGVAGVEIFSEKKMTYDSIHAITLMNTPIALSLSPVDLILMSARRIELLKFS